MWRLLCLLLAFVAPAQASIHHDGFEARMPVSDWVNCRQAFAAGSILKDGVATVFNIASRSSGEIDIKRDAVS